MKAIDRLYEYFSLKHLKPTAIEKTIGLSNGYLSAQKKRNADMGEGIMIKILDYCRDLNPEWLLTGYGSMLREGELPPQPIAQVPANDSIYKELYEKAYEEIKKLLKNTGSLEGKLEGKNKELELKCKELLIKDKENDELVKRNKHLENGLLDNLNDKKTIEEVIMPSSKPIKKNNEVVDSANARSGKDL